MLRPSARQLLDGWEAFRSEVMPLRAAALAALATGQPIEAVTRWPISRRDGALFDLRAQLFGDVLDGVTACPCCAEALELQVSLAQLRPTGPTRASARWRLLRVGRERVRWRLPDTDDLLAVAGLGRAADVRAALLARCVEAEDPALRERVAARLPTEPTDVRFDLACPACAHCWQMPFDIAAFTWREVDDWARRTLAEIHIIAATYGWTEDEILRLSARRRQEYVGMIQ